MAIDQMEKIKIRTGSSVTVTHVAPHFNTEFLRRILEHVARLKCAGTLIRPSPVLDPESGHPSV